MTSQLSPRRDVHLGFRLRSGVHLLVANQLKPAECELTRSVSWHRDIISSINARIPRRYLTTKLKRVTEVSFARIDYIKN